MLARRYLPILLTALGATLVLPFLLAKWIKDKSKRARTV